MKKRDPESGKSRRRYEKPRLRSFPLAADEVLAKGGETTTPGSGPTGANCSSGGSFNPGP